MQSERKFSFDVRETAGFPVNPERTLVSIVRVPTAILITVFLVSASLSEASSIKELKKVEQMKKEVNELFEEGKYRSAIPLLERIISINPTDRTAARYLRIAKQHEIEPYCQRADEAYMQGEYETAINEWEEILKLSPEDARVEKMIELTRNLIHDNILESMYALVDKFLREEDFVAAANELEKILMLQPEEKRARELLISTQQAITNTRIKTLYEKAEHYMKDEKYDLAIKQWQKILEIDEKQEEASRLIASARRTKLDSMYNQAKQAYEKGNYALSRDLYYKLMTENPTDEEVKVMAGRLNEVINVVQKIDGKGLQWDMLRTALANHIALDGSTKAAIVASWYSGQLEPGNKAIAAIQNFLEKQHPTVVRSLEPPVRDMNIIEQYLFAALNHIYEGRYDLAIQESSIVVALQPQNTLALKRLGSAYFALGKKEKAREAWKKALKISPNDKELDQFIKQLK